MNRGANFFFKDNRLLLDKNDNIALAYSLRKLTSNINFVARVRDSGDDSEADYTAEDIINGLTAIGSDDGFITKLYRQDGNSHGDLEQSTFGKQPKILNAGSLYLNNTKPFIKFDGVDDEIKTIASTALTDQACTIYCVFKTQSNSSIDAVFDEDAAISGTGRNNILSSTDTSLDGFSYTASGAQRLYNDLVAKSTDTVYLTTFKSSGGPLASTKVYYQNGILQESSNFGNEFNQNTTIGIGNRNVSSLWFSGEFAELIIFSEEHEDVKRNEIEAEIMSYYGI